ncbi:MAG: phosphatidate cytidylyltransferase [Chloroflexi bacterium]|nr:phosphatidate cytidylyltransferase [Chloroflexota bacterium]
MLRTRVLSAAILLPIVAVVVYLGGLWLFALMAAALSLAAWEFRGMMRKGGFRPEFLCLYLPLAVLLVLAQGRWDAYLPLALTALFILTLSWQLLLPNRTTPTADWALALGMGLYLGWMGGHFLRIRALDNGLAWAAIALVTTWISDSGAYFVGTWLGRHKLAPRLSPKKTWEGIVGGWLTAEVAAVLLGRLVGLTTPQGLTIGLAVAVLAPLGDLSISMMKRQVGVKDSGNLIPGHGGMLDRLDSLLFVVPAVYYLATWFR